MTLRTLAVAAALALVSPVAAEAHRVPSQQTTGKVRPPVVDASHAANHRAKHDCVNRIFPYDPMAMRCRAAGVHTEIGDKGFNRDYFTTDYVRKTRTAWYFRGWATNNNFTTLAFTVRVRYKPSGPAKGLVATLIPKASECYWQVDARRNESCNLTF